MAKGGRPKPSDSSAANETTESTQEHLHVRAEAAAEIEEEEEMAEQFITLAELTANRLSDTGLYGLYRTCIDNCWLSYIVGREEI